MMHVRCTELHGLDQICTDFARIRTDMHGCTDAARTLHGYFMVPVELEERDVELTLI